MVNILISVKTIFIGCVQLELKWDPSAGVILQKKQPPAVVLEMVIKVTEKKTVAECLLINCRLSAGNVFKMEFWRRCFLVSFGWLLRMLFYRTPLKNWERLQLEKTNKKFFNQQFFICLDNLGKNSILSTNNRLKSSL